MWDYSPEIDIIHMGGPVTSPLCLTGTHRDIKLEARPVRDVKQ